MKILIFELAFLGGGKLSICGKPLEKLSVGARLTHIELAFAQEDGEDISCRAEFGPAVVVGITTYGKDVLELAGGMSGQLDLELEKGVRISLLAE